MAGSDKQVVAYLYASLSCGDTGARDSQAALFGIGHYTLLFLEDEFFYRGRGGSCYVCASERVGSCSGLV